MRGGVPYIYIYIFHSNAQQGLTTLNSISTFTFGNPYSQRLVGSLVVLACFGFVLEFVLSLVSARHGGSGNLLEHCVQMALKYKGLQPRPILLKHVNTEHREECR